MDLKQLSFPIFMNLVLFLFIVLKILKNQNRKLPPGPWKLPLIGNMHQLNVSNLVHHTLRDLAMKYGPLMYLKMGQIPTVVVSSPELAKEVMRTHDAKLVSRPVTLLTRILFYNSKGLIFSQDEDYWRQLRKICVQELLSISQVQSYRHIREESISDIVKWIASNEGSSINFTKMIKAFTYAVSSRSAFGKGNKDCEEFISVVEDVAELGARFDVSELFPSLGFLVWLSPLASEFKRLHHKSDRILENIIKEHNKEKSATKSCKETKYFIDVLLRAQENGGQQEGSSVTKESVKAVIWEVFSAASETSSTSIDWAMAEMMRNPRVMKRAQEEVRQVFTRRGSVDETGIGEMPYLKCVVKETLRLHPPLPLLLPRENKEKLEINGYEVPARTRFIVNAWAIGRDPKYWTEPEIFMPERFLESSIDYKGNDFEFVPFGSGRRMCPGASLGLINTELPLAFFLNHFDWKLPDGLTHEDVDMTELFGIAVRRKNDLHLIPSWPVNRLSAKQALEKK